MSLKKANFNNLYNALDPRAYYSQVSSLNYLIPHHAQAIIRSFIDLNENTGQTTVLDLCCGYGVNSALLNFDITLEKLYDYYESTQGITSFHNEMVSNDKNYFSKKRHSSSTIEIIGIDAADNAIDYAHKTHLIDHGLVYDLERSELNQSAETIISKAKLIIVTGGLSYIGSCTFKKLLRCYKPSEMPVILWFSLCATDVSSVLSTFKKFGLHTSCSTHKFPQRFIHKDKDKLLGNSAESKDSILYSYLYISAVDVDIAKTLGIGTTPSVERIPLIA